MTVDVASSLIPFAIVWHTPDVGTNDSMNPQQLRDELEGRLRAIHVSPYSALQEYARGLVALIQREETLRRVVESSISPEIGLREQLFGRPLRSFHQVAAGTFEENLGMLYEGVSVLATADDNTFFTIVQVGYGDEGRNFEDARSEIVAGLVELLLQHVRELSRKSQKRSHFLGSVLRPIWNEASKYVVVIVITLTLLLVASRIEIVREALRRALN